jgi:hypothetical protein
VAVPKGTAFSGHLTSAKSSGRLRGRAVLGLTLDSFELNGRRYQIDTTSVSRASASLCYSPELYDEYFALYRYTFPEHPMINAVQPRRGSDPAARERVFYRDLERAWLLGSFFWSNPDAFRPGDDRLLNDLARAIRLRRLAEPYLAEARYRDTDELVIDGARVTRFDGKDCTLLAVANPLGVPGSVTVAEPPATVTCLEVGKETERNWSKDGRRILLPTASLSLLILR